MGVPLAVMVLGAALVGLILVNLATDAQPDYADLVPPPDSIVWEEGSETTVWLATNRRDVELRVDSVALGVGGIQRASPDAGETMTLGRGEGCQPWAVSRLTAGGIDSTGFRIEGELDRNGYADDAVVRVRVRQDGGTATERSVTVAGGDSAFELLYAAPSGTWRVDASSAADFAAALTRSVTVDIDAGTATVDETVQSIPVLQNTGLGIIACDAGGDVVVSLHGEEGEELNSYLVDVGPPPVSPPSPPAPFVTRRVCVDGATDRAGYLDGGEQAGAVFDRNDFDLSGDIDSVAVLEADVANDFIYYFDHTLTGGSVQLTVSDVGASDTLGLDSERVYPVRLTATAGDEAASLDVGVWLDASNISPGGDGRCP